MTPSRAQLEEHVPWKVSDQVSERMDFVMRLRDGETMSELCREFGISRKTGYKLRDRFEELGPVGLYDQPRVAKRLPHKTDAELAKRVVEARRQHPTWGPKKLRAWLQGRESGVSWPCTSTIGEILKREGLVQPRKLRRNTPPYEAPLEKAHAPHDVWCADFKGQFRLGNGKLCYPLTITDRFTRTILCCEALESTATDSALLVFEKTFREHGLPKVIRTDNGIPFASKGVLGLSRLSVRWLRLGIWPERIAPAHPEQNGQHERMHLVLKQETTRPAARTLLAQQERFDRFVEEYNTERPHEALGQKTPMSLYSASPRSCPTSLPELEYPLADVVMRVHDGGNLLFPNRRLVSISSVLSDERVGLREIEDGKWIVLYGDFELGLVDVAARCFVPRTELRRGASPGDRIERRS